MCRAARQALADLGHRGRRLPGGGVPPRPPSAWPASRRASASASARPRSARSPSCSSVSTRYADPDRVAGRPLRPAPVLTAAAAADGHSVRCSSRSPRPTRSACSPAGCSASATRMTFVSVLRLVAAHFPARRYAVVAAHAALGALGNLVATLPLDPAARQRRLDRDVRRRRCCSPPATRWCWCFACATNPPGAAGAAGGTRVAALRARPGPRTRGARPAPGSASGCTSPRCSPRRCSGLLWGFPYLVQAQGLPEPAASSVLGVLVLGAIVGGPVIGAVISRRPELRMPTGRRLPARRARRVGRAAAAGPGDAGRRSSSSGSRCCRSGGPVSAIGVRAGPRLQPAAPGGHGDRRGQRRRVRRHHGVGAGRRPAAGGVRRRLPAPRSGSRCCRRRAAAARRRGGPRVVAAGAGGRVRRPAARGEDVPVRIRRRVDGTSPGLSVAAVHRHGFLARVPTAASTRPTVAPGLLRRRQAGPGMTSHDVVARVRRIMGTRKVGHAGTLDPMATGVLVLGIERATKLLGHLALDRKATWPRSASASPPHRRRRGRRRAEVDALVGDRRRHRRGVRGADRGHPAGPQSVSAVKIDGKRATRGCGRARTSMLAAAPGDRFPVRPAGHRAAAAPPSSWT